MPTSVSRAAHDSDDEAFQVLVHSLEREREYGEGSCLLLGAGCSLTSSPRDISTVGLIRDFILDITGEENLTHLSSTELFRKFVNLWYRLGELQARSELEKRLAGLQPSHGYKALRALVDAGYFSRIVTTNFDLLLDEALHDLPYELRVGEGKLRRVGHGKSRCLILKVHGDIRQGGIRFVPAAVASLPSVIADEVRAATRLPTLVTGYRGQDCGLMSALNTAADFNAFWAAPEPPNRADRYTYDPVFSWLRSRGSENNLLFGRRFGYFDALMSGLEAALARRAPRLSYRVPEAARLPAAWQRSYLGLLLQQSQGVATVLAELLRTSEHLTATGEWLETSPHFARGYEDLLAAFLDALNDQLAPDALLRALETEVEAVLLATALEVKVRSQGMVSSAPDLLERLRSQFTEECPDYSLHDSFWEAVGAILAPAAGAADTREIRLSPYAGRELTLRVSKLNLKPLRKLLQVVDALALAMPTASADSSLADGARRAKLMLQSGVSEIRSSDRKTTVFLSQMVASDFGALCKVLRSRLDPLPSSAGEHPDHFQTQWFDVRAQLTATAAEAPQQPQAGGLITALHARSAQTSRRLLSEGGLFRLADRQPVALAADRTLQEFLGSDHTGLILVGSSGSGKTTAIRGLYQRGQADRSLLPVALSPHSISPQRSAASLFLEPVLGRSDAGELPKRLAHIDNLLDGAGAQLLLILDGLNEVPCSQRELVSVYESVLDLADLVSEIRARRIRLILTCRESTFNFLLSRRMPSPSSFMCPRIAKGRAEPYLQIRGLSSSELIELVELYFSAPVAGPFLDFVRTNRFAARQYAHPYLLAVAGSVLKRPPDIQLLGSAGDIFGLFSRHMFERLGDESDRIGARLVLERYFDDYLSEDGRGRIISRVKVIASFGLDERQAALTALRKLEDVSVLRSSQSEAVAGVLGFSHDRIAEHFLAEYLAERRHDQALMVRVPKLAMADSVCLGGLRNLFRMLFAEHLRTAEPLSDEGLEAALLSAKVFDNLQVPHLAEVLAGSMVLGEDTGRIVRAMLARALSPDAAEHPLLAGPRELVRVLLHGASSLIERFEIADVEPLLAAIREECTSNSQLADYRAEALACHARCCRLEARQEEALAMLDEAEEAIRDREDEALRDQVALERAVLIGQAGEKARAIGLLRAVYESQVQHQAWDQAAATALELGAALRDDTKFDEALELYSALGKRAFGPSTRARLELQKGIIVKNLLQRLSHDDALRSDVAATEKDSDMLDLYERASGHFQQAHGLARDARLVLVEAEALSEMAAVELVAARWDVGGLGRASAHLETLERLLGFFPILARRIEFQRYSARLAESRGEFDVALGYLETGRRIAAQYDDSFRACDCDYQIGHMVLRTIEQQPEVSYYRRGLRAFSDAIAYYRGHVSKDNEYLRRVTAGHERLRDIGIELGYEPDIE